MTNEPTRSEPADFGGGESSGQQDLLSGSGDSDETENTDEPTEPVRLEDTMRENTETKETVYSGVSITGKVKFGSDTRDQGELHLKGKGKDAEEAAEDFEETLQAAEEGRWSDRMIALNPDRASFDVENVQGGSDE